MYMRFSSPDDNALSTRVALMALLLSCSPLALAADDVPAQTAANPDNAASRYTLSSQPFYLDATGPGLGGTVLPSTRLQVLSRQDSRLQASLRGWQQEGAEGVMYAAAGKRIISATLGDAAKRQLRHSDTDEVVTAGQKWHEVTLTIWLDKTALTDRLPALWQQAGKLYEANCGGCHSLPAPKNFSANQWPAVMRSMTPRTSLNKEQIRLLTQYVQKHAGDMSAAAKP